MSNLAEFSYSGYNVFVSPLLPIDEVEYYDDPDEPGERIGRLTGRKNHCLFMKTERMFLVSQELYDKIKQLPNNQPNDRQLNDPLQKMPFGLVLPTHMP